MQNIRFPQASNRADWTCRFTVTDPNDGTLVDLSPYTVTIQVSRRDRSWPELSGSTTDGHVIFPGSGVISFTFRASEMNCLVSGTYEVGAIVTDGTNTTQLLIGTVPVVDGIVRS
jgi:hypothetical protein